MEIQRNTPPSIKETQWQLAVQEYMVSLWDALDKLARTVETLWEKRELTSDDLACLKSITPIYAKERVAWDALADTVKGRAEAADLGTVSMGQAGCNLEQQM